MYKNEEESRTAQSDVGVAIYEREVNLSSGIMKAQIDNLSTSSQNNKYQQYLNRLDSFSMTLSDISDKYIKVSEGKYIYGEAATDENLGSITSIGLFSGTNVKSLQFN